MIIIILLKLIKAEIINRSFPQFCLLNNQSISLNEAIESYNQTCMIYNNLLWKCTIQDDCQSDKRIRTRKVLHKIKRCINKCETLRGDIMYKKDAVKKNLMMWKNNNKYYCGSLEEAKKESYLYSDLKFNCQLDKNLNSSKLEFPLTDQLIFNDDFEELKVNESKWEFETSTWGGGNQEFQYYDKNLNVTYTKNGKLYIKPRLTSETYGSKVINQGILDLGKLCKNSDNSNCTKISDGKNILNPIQSGKLTSKMSFKYGKVQVKMRLPKGDWLWPAFWFLPKDNIYGNWPRSGEIDLMESRGNNDTLKKGGVNTVSTTLHWGSDFSTNQYLSTTNTLTPFKKENRLFNEFHIYTLEWYKSGIRTSIDDQIIFEIPFKTPYNHLGKSFTELGNFTTQQSPWIKGTSHAPFDQPFFMLINLAVGGKNGYFDDEKNKPWNNSDPYAPLQFLKQQDKWFPTWPKDDSTAYAIDYVKVWSYKSK